MKKILIWARRFLFALLLLLGAAWVFAEASQWLLRYRAQKLFTDIRTIEVNRSSSTEAEAILSKWSRYGTTISNCDGDLCRSSLIIRHLVPAVLRGVPGEEAWNLLPRLVDHLGLRNEGVGIGFTTEHGIVTRKEFGEMVALPVEDWYIRDHAYVPDLDVWTGEAAKFHDYELRRVSTSHPFRMVRNQKGPYGVLVTFKPEEDPSEKAALMNFQFSCMTQFFPCRSEREILPEGWQMLQEQP